MATLTKEEFSNWAHIAKLVYANNIPELAWCCRKRTLWEARGLSSYVTLGNHSAQIAPENQSLHLEYLWGTSNSRKKKNSINLSIHIIYLYLKIANTVGQWSSRLALKLLLSTSLHIFRMKDFHEIFLWKILKLYANRNAFAPTEIGVVSEHRCVYSNWWRTRL